MDKQALANKINSLTVAMLMKTEAAQKHDGESYRLWQQSYDVMVLRIFFEHGVELPTIDRVLLMPELVKRARFEADMGFE